MDINVKEKVALVTGAGSGIGKAAALLLAKEGAKVVAIGRTEDKLQQAVGEIQLHGGEAIFVLADVSQSEEMKRAVEKTIAQYHHLDIVFANAGINGVAAPIEEIEAQEWEQTLDVNLKGTFLTLKHAIPYLKRQGGSVIITASTNGTRVFSLGGLAAYSSSKAGQVAFTKMAALELAKHQIRVNVICPGAIESDIEDSMEIRNIEEAEEPAKFANGVVPLTGGKKGKAEQVANLVLFLASDASSHITGTEVWIDGAESLLGETFSSHQ
jgi:NAD(P)-dependent dehydrogenase (short-subunit alcohol dehydrogenase family)